MISIPRAVKDGDTTNFSDYRTVGDKDVSDFVFLDFAARRPGWIGKSNAMELRPGVFRSLRGS
jgi:hypothetical protein